MPEGFGDLVKEIGGKLGKFAGKAWKEMREGGIAPERPQRVPVLDIDEKAVVWAYWRWIKTPDSYRFVSPEIKWAPFDVEELLYALGYGKATEEERLGPRARANNILNDMERRDVLTRILQRDPNTGEQHSMFVVNNSDYVLKLVELESKDQKK